MANEQYRNRTGSTTDDAGEVRVEMERLSARDGFTCPIVHSLRPRVKESVLPDSASSFLSFYNQRGCTCSVIGISILWSTSLCGTCTGIMGRHFSRILMRITVIGVLGGASVAHGESYFDHMSMIDQPLPNGNENAIMNHVTICHQQHPM